MNDVRLILRQLAKARSFTVVAVATLALGIGSTAAIFSVIEAFLLRPLPYLRPAELVNVACEMPGSSRANIGTSVPEFEDLRDRSGVFAELSIVFPMNGNLTGVDQPQRVEAMAVSPNFFRLLGAPALLGRTFGDEEARVTGWAEGCVLSYAAWQRCFGGDPGVLGRKIWLDYDTYRVIGVMPPAFHHPGRTLSSDADVWFTGGLRTPPFRPERTRRNIPGIIGRLRPGLTLAAAQARLEVFAAETRRQFPNDYPAEGRWSAQVLPLRQQLYGNVQGTLWLLFAAVSLLLLICAATFVNLLLVRAAGRRQEIAVRVALGATRGDIVRNFCLESAVLALAGGVAGLLLAAWLPEAVLALTPANLPVINRVEVNLPVAAFAAALAVVTGLACGLLAARQAGAGDVISDLKDGGRNAGGGRGSHRLRAGFAVAQVALSVVLLAGGGVLLTSFWRALAVHPGFDPAHVTVARIWLPPPTDPKARQSYRNAAYRVTFMREVLRRVRELPGVTSASIGAGQSVPLSGDWNPTTITPEGEPSAGDRAGAALLSAVTPDYFRALRIRVLRGRAFAESDDGDNRVALVSAAAAARFWPDRDPIGRRVALDNTTPRQWWTIIGVVNDVKTEGLDAPVSPHLYVPAYQRTAMGVTLFVRASGGTALLREPIAQVIRAIDPDLPVFAVTPLDTIVSRSLAPRRFAVAIVGAFAVAAVTLAALGIYGVVAFGVSQRTREIGVRMALGAERRHIFGLVLREGLKLTAFGGALGLAGGVLVTAGLRTVLFETSPLDPATFAGVLGLLSAVALLASLLPARRASAVDPIVALRGE